MRACACVWWLAADEVMLFVALFIVIWSHRCHVCACAGTFRLCLCVFACVAVQVCFGLVCAVQCLPSSHIIMTPEEMGPPSAWAFCFDSSPLWGPPGGTGNAATCLGCLCVCVCVCVHSSSDRKTSRTALQFLRS